MLKNRAEIEDAGFSGFETIGNLRATGLVAVPKKMGVYLVLRLADEPVRFLDISTGGHFKNRDPTVSLNDLHSNWVANTPVLYIGKAGGKNNKATLQSRLRQYINFGAGKPVGHWGGRLIWQISGSNDLVVCWKPTPANEPRTVEKALIAEFKAAHGGKRPLANLRD